jgi:hypothetical protein
MAACLRHDPLQLHQEIRQDHAQRCFDLGDSLKRQPTKFLIYARVFKTMEGIIQHNPELQREAEVQSKTIYLANGTTVTAISGDYAGAAGSNHGFSSWDELWGYTSESSRLDLIGKTNPATFRPALQIDSIDARLLIEALGAFRMIGGIKEPFGTMSPTRFLFSSQRWRPCRAMNKSR